MFIVIAGGGKHGARHRRPVSGGGAREQKRGTRAFARRPP